MRNSSRYKKRILDPNAKETRTSKNEKPRKVVERKKNYGNSIKIINSKCLYSIKTKKGYISRFYDGKFDKKLKFNSRTRICLIDFISWYSPYHVSTKNIEDYLKENKLKLKKHPKIGYRKTLEEIQKRFKIKFNEDVFECIDNEGAKINDKIFPPNKRIPDNVF